jgi:hypothetical protein
MKSCLHEASMQRLNGTNLVSHEIMPPWSFHAKLNGTNLLARVNEHHGERGVHHARWDGWWYPYVDKKHFLFSFSSSSIANHGRGLACCVLTIHKFCSCIIVPCPNKNNPLRSFCLVIDLKNRAFWRESFCVLSAVAKEVVRREVGGCRWWWKTDLHRSDSTKTNTHTYLHKNTHTHTHMYIFIGNK